MRPRNLGEFNSLSQTGLTALSETAYEQLTNLCKSRGGQLTKAFLFWELSSWPPALARHFLRLARLSVRDSHRSGI